MAVRRASRSRFVLLLLILTAGTIITLSYRTRANHAIDRVKSWASDVFKPVETGFRDAWDPVANFFRGAVDYGSEKSANAQLRQEVGNLRRQSLERTDQARQLKALLALDKLPFAGTLPKVTAQVIHPVSIMGFLASVLPGTRFELEKRPIGNGIWAASHFSMHSSALVLGLFSHKSQQDQTFTDYTPASAE